MVTPADQIPVFVKGGAIVPMQPEMNYTDEKPVSEITFDVFPGEKPSAFNLYEDDGLSLEYQKGNFALTGITTTPGIGAFKLNISKTTGQYAPSNRTYLAKVRWPYEKAPAKVTVNGKIVSAAPGSSVTAKTGWYYDADKHELYIKTAGNQKDNTEILVNF